MEETESELVAEVGTVENVTSSTWSYITRYHAPLFFGVSFFVVVWSIGITALIIAIQANGIELDSHVIALPFLPLIIPFAMYGHYRGRVKDVFLQEIGQELGYTYTATAAADSVHGAFFEIGHSGMVYDVFSGTDKGQPVRIFTYRYITGLGKNSQTHYYTVFELAYGDSLPHVVMNFPAFQTPNGMERVELEGNFSDTLDLSVEPGKQMEVREIFQPDAMQDFAAAMKGFTMEIYDDRVYLMRKGELGNRQTFLDLTAAVDRVFADFLPGLRAASNGVTVQPSLAN